MFSVPVEAYTSPRALRKTNEDSRLTTTYVVPALMRFSVLPSVMST